MDRLRSEYYWQSFASMSERNVPAMKNESANHSDRCRGKGFTLVELLVVMGVIGVLAALLFPTVAASLRSGYRAQDISNMRQLGIAQAIYTQDYGEMALDASRLAKVGLVDPKILLSRFDPYPGGLATDIANQEVLQGLPENEIMPLYPLSYIDIGVLNWGQVRYAKDIANQPEPGWLIDPFFEGNQPDVLICFQLLRLENDGSVRFKHPPTIGNCTTVPIECGFPLIAYFADGDAKWASHNIPPFISR